MGLRRKKSTLQVLQEDIKINCERDGDTVTFQWVETTGGFWNEDYEVWEGGTKETKEHKIRGIGKVVDYKEDQMETEWGRVNVGECIVRFPHDSGLFEVLAGKENVRFIYKNQRWVMDSPLNVGDMYNDQFFALTVLGVKSTD